MAALQGVGTPAPAVFVGNLSYDLTDQNIIDYFGQCGPVKSVRIVSDRETGRPRGFGFVEFYDIPTAESAIRNLSGKDFNGRVIRIVFAEGGPFEARGMGPSSGQRGAPPAFGGAGAGAPPPFDDRGRGGRPPNTSRVIGGDLAYHSSLGAAQLLGGSGTPGQTADALTKLLARRSRSELYALLAQVQTLAGADRAAARDLLAANPALTKALFQSQIILGYVSNPRGDVAPKGIAPPGTMPGRGFPGHEPAQYQHAEPAQYQHAAPGPMVSAAPAPSYAPYAAAGANGGYPAGMAPPPYQPQADAGHHPADPRHQRSGRYAPGMTAPLESAPAPAAPGMAATAGMTPDQQQALLQQVLSLTPAQLESLPADQKAQVLALQQQMRGTGI